MKTLHHQSNVEPARRLRIPARFALWSTVLVAAVLARAASALTINFVYDPDATFSAAGMSADDIAAMKNANAFAAKQFTDRFNDNININIKVTATPGTSDLGSSSTTFDPVDSYASLQSLVAKDATSADDNTAVGAGGSMPAGNDPITDPHDYQLTRAQAKALGLRADDMEIDGTFSFGGGQPWSYDPNNRAPSGKQDFIGVAMHEYSEIMGRNSLMGMDLGTGKGSYVQYDLFHYTGAGARGVGPVAGRGPGRSFSIDNGTTLLKAFNDETGPNKGDNQDWLGPDPDSFNAFGGTGELGPLTDVDVRVMDIVGFNLTTAGPTPTPSATPSPGETPTPTPAATPSPGETPTPTPSATASPGETPTPSPSATPSPSGAPTRLANISTRLAVQTGDNVLIGGFIVTGNDPKKVLVRALGPSLGIPGQLENPTLELRDQAGSLITGNDNWKEGNQQTDIEATMIPPTNDLESAIVATLPANNARYTAQVRGVGETTGIGLVEVYDIGPNADSKLANISTRGFVQTDNNVMIGGVIITGTETQRVLIRAIGPSLPVEGKLADPTLELREANGNLLQANDNWKTDQQAEIEATSIPPTSDLESAIVRTLAPANYTAIVRGVNNATGVALVEVYAIP